MRQDRGDDDRTSGWCGAKSTESPRTDIEDIAREDGQKSRYSAKQCRREVKRHCAQEDRLAPNESNTRDQSRPGNFWPLCRRWRDRQKKACDYGNGDQQRTKPKSRAGTEAIEAATQDGTDELRHLPSRCMRGHGPHQQRARHRVGDERLERGAFERPGKRVDKQQGKNELNRAGEKGCQRKESK